MIKDFFEDMLGVQEVLELLKEFTVGAVLNHQSLDEEFEEYLAGNLTRILTTLQIKLKPEQILSYLCVKIKSLNKSVRQAALSSLTAFPHL